MRTGRLLLAPLVGVIATALVSACVARHLSRDIPPPGGCDRCHRGKISNNWELTVAPVELGREGGVPLARDVVLRQVRTVPYHREVPSKRLEIIAAAAPEAVVGDGETGIQCFVCHRSPDALHRSDKAQFHHPWQTKDGQPSSP